MKIKISDINKINVGKITIYNYNYYKFDLDHLSLLCKYLRFKEKNNTFDFILSIVILEKHFKINYNENNEIKNITINYDLLYFDEDFFIIFNDIEEKNNYIRKNKLEKINDKK